MEIQLLPLTLGITQFIKNLFDLKGKKVQLVAVLVTFTVYLLLQVPLYLPQYATVEKVFIEGLVWSLSSIGLYDVGKNEIAPEIGKHLGKHLGK